MPGSADRKDSVNIFSNAVIYNVPQQLRDYPQDDPDGFFSIFLQNILVHFSQRPQEPFRRYRICF